MKKGFTLIEMMVVITVIGFLSAIALPRFTDSTRDAKVAQVQGNLASLRSAIGMYQAAWDTYPAYGDIEGGGDISDTGDLSEAFQEYYSKGMASKTPASHAAGESNKVVAVRDDSGGWLYIEESGEIYANLPDGNYTGDEDEEIWAEEGETDGSKPVEPPVDTDPKELSGDKLGIFDTEPDDLLGFGYGDDGLRYEDGRLEVSPFRGGVLVFEEAVREISITASYYIEEDGWKVTDNGNGTYTYERSFDPATDSVDTPKPGFGELWSGENYIDRVEYR